MVDSSHFVCECDVATPDELKIHGANCSLAILKCPWQWREPFLDERRNKLKRKLGDTKWKDPVDPAFIDHLEPGAGKKLFRDVESDELSKIKSEIQRLNQAKASCSEHASSWDEHDDDVTKTTEAECWRKGSESPNTVAAPMCTTEDMAYLDSILLPVDLFARNEDAFEPNSAVDSTADVSTVIGFHGASMDEPVLHLLSDRYDTYLTYDDEELSIGSDNDGSTTP
ncbi:hypothetical protein H310_05452 [Aphanomyces invadans]|uniref:Uncharacterized protein n=1 Tax=Aphanomyces invadans TaxID=157072 RepID=A0A024U9Y5_9STRA|nr:hypothetical protein H310_05452 [Aphanomyces invadans]ETW03020.1 hypothetical protein H310_05452 [Aphanomyces invadans]RHY32131.1 hypothetical protein DYB32_002837 [Aphanomyces invadans]|eukprot:XP_008868404.1 hypothetical protein H310_05452 [Aphanomyces invadans]